MTKIMTFPPLICDSNTGGRVRLGEEGMHACIFFFLGGGGGGGGGVSV